MLTNEAGWSILIVKGGLAMGWSCPYEVKWFCQRLRKECRPGQRGCVLQDRVTYFDPNEALAHWSKHATRQAASNTDKEALSADEQLLVSPGGNEPSNSSSD